MIAIAFIHNLLRRHPACSVLLHRAKPPLQSAAMAQGINDSVEGDVLAPKRSEQAAVLEDSTLPGTAPSPGAGTQAAATRSQDADDYGNKEGDKSLAPLSKVDSVWCGKDAYDADAGNPAAARALDSSLWELTALRRHYCPQVWQGIWRNSMEPLVSYLQGCGHLVRLELKFKDEKKMQILPSTLAPA